MSTVIQCESHLIPHVLAIAKKRGITAEEWFYTQDDEPGIEIWHGDADEVIAIRDKMQKEGVGSIEREYTVHHGRKFLGTVKGTAAEAFEKAKERWSYLPSYELIVK